VPPMQFYGHANDHSRQWFDIRQ